MLLINVDKLQTLIALSTQVDRLLGPSQLQPIGIMAKKHLLLQLGSMSVSEI
jgi:hypothetical protein